MNKITCHDGNGEGPCLVCGTLTAHYHVEKKHPNNTAHICPQCCRGEIQLKLVIKTYECKECGRSTESPARLPNGIFQCPFPDCQTVYPPKELEKIEE